MNSQSCKQRSLYQYLFPYFYLQFGRQHKGLDNITCSLVFDLFLSSLNGLATTVYDIFH